MASRVLICLYVLHFYVLVPFVVMSSREELSPLDSVMHCQCFCYTFCLCTGPLSSGINTDVDVVLIWLQHVIRDIKTFIICTRSGRKPRFHC